MIKILFVCHGNICRSPMAEFIFKDMVKRKGYEGDFEIDSAATSTEEIGNDMYYPAKECLNRHNIPYTKRASRRVSKNDLDYYDYIIAMEEYNIHNLKRYLGDSSKYSLLLDFTDEAKDIDDPWYTNNFEKAYEEIVKGCTCILNKLI